jgi:hypothetical protein
VIGLPTAFLFACQGLTHVDGGPHGWPVESLASEHPCLGAFILLADFLWNA